MGFMTSSPPDLKDTKADVVCSVGVCVCVWEGGHRADLEWLGMRPMAQGRKDESHRTFHRYLDLCHGRGGGMPKTLEGCCRAEGTGRPVGRRRKPREAKDGRHSG